MKYPVSWYQDNLKNMKDNLSREENVLQHQEEKIVVLKEHIDILEEQIKKAIMLKKDSFDSDKFNKIRGAKK